jgi:DNA-binding NtrC family response regulator
MVYRRRAAEDLQVLGQYLTAEGFEMVNDRQEAFRILIVDDNRELREILGEYLGGEGDSIDGAGDGREALEKYKASPYDLIITDLNMPELTGIELIREVARFESNTEFIIVTGYASLDTAIEAVKIGAFDYIVKPFRMEELKVVVKNAKDKIALKKVNARLFDKLTRFYEELARYRQADRTGGSHAIDTEGILNEVMKLDLLRKGRFAAK